MTIEQFEYALCEARDKAIKYREDGNCKHTICSECEHYNICKENEDANI